MRHASALDKKYMFLWNFNDMTNFAEVATYFPDNKLSF